MRFFSIWQATVVDLCLEMTFEWNSHWIAQQLCGVWNCLKHFSRLKEMTTASFLKEPTRFSRELSVVVVHNLSIFLLPMTVFSCWLPTQQLLLSRPNSRRSNFFVSITSQGVHFSSIQAGHFDFATYSKPDSCSVQLGIIRMVHWWKTGDLTAWCSDMRT